MGARLGKKINVPGICDPDCLRKFKVLLAQAFITKEETALPTHIKFKAKLQRTGLSKEVHLEVYTNNNVEIKASPEIQASFTSIWPEIEAILRESISVVSRQNVVRVNRAKEILDYIQTIPLNNEVGKMAIVVLCDITLDLLVTEKLSKYTHTRQDLENESIGAKIDLLEQKYTVPLYKKKSIRDIRELRNKIAHGGAPTSQDEAIFAREASNDIFSLF